MKEVRRYYKPVPSCHDGFPTIWVDFKVDVLCIRESRHSTEYSETTQALKHLQNIRDMHISRVLLLSFDFDSWFIHPASIGLTTWPKTPKDAEILLKLNLREVSIHEHTPGDEIGSNLVMEMTRQRNSSPSHLESYELDSKITELVENKKIILRRVEPASYSLLNKMNYTKFGFEYHELDLGTNKLVHRRWVPSGFKSVIHTVEFTKSDSVALWNMGVIV
jgi:hypothetical protein